MKIAPFAVQAVALCAIAAWCAGAQDAAKFDPPKPRRQFEVASVKPAAPGQPVSQNPVEYSPAGRFTARNATLVDVIVRVYPTRRIQMQGGPDWIDSDRFDIVAKADASAGDIPRADWMSMVQGLLEDRFQLKFHHEIKETTAYSLLPGKKTAELETPKEGEETGVKIEQGKFIFTNMTMAGLVNTLSNLLHLPLVDRTELTGRYDFTLDPYRFVQNVDPSTPMRREEIGDLLLAAVRVQLGLRVEKQKAPLDIVVIDRAERPTAN
jgi:uncharacterized protein (TIGR03435 family)